MPVDVLLMTGLVALAIGLFRVPEFLLAGGDVEPEPLAMVLEDVIAVDGDTLIGIGATAAAGLMISVDPW